MLSFRGYLAAKQTLSKTGLTPVRTFSFVVRRVQPFLSHRAYVLARSSSWTDLQLIPCVTSNGKRFIKEAFYLADKHS